MTVKTCRLRCIERGIWAIFCLVLVQSNTILVNLANKMLEDIQLFRFESSNCSLAKRFLTPSLWMWKGVEFAEFQKFNSGFIPLVPWVLQSPFEVQKKKSINVSTPNKQSLHVAPRFGNPVEVRRCTRIPWCSSIVGDLQGEDFRPKVIFKPWPFLFGGSDTIYARWYYLKPGDMLLYLVIPPVY